MVLTATNQVKSLNNIKSRYVGLPGVNGASKNLYGANADHTFVEVPIGTLVLPARPKDISELDYDPNKSDIIADLDTEGSMFIAARGGSGGHGNLHYLSNKNRHPMIAEKGADGEVNIYELRMKLYAHVGLIGLPNVGKSTLLSTLTGAQVEVANYSFTTKYPQVGVIEFNDFTQVAISDLPGLIEESHVNRGLGLEFLRCLEHCACLLYVIDLSLDPINQFKVLANELEMHKKGMSHRPHMILANKIDHPDSLRNLASFEQFINELRPNTKVVVGSSLRGDGLEELRNELRRLHDEYQERNKDELDTSLTW